MRWVGLLLIPVLALGAMLAPVPDPPVPGPGSGVEEPPVAVCAIEEGSGRSTTVSVLSTVDGPVRLTAFVGGGLSGSAELRTGPSGSAKVAVVDVAAVGTVGGLVEMPVATSTAGTVVLGSESAAAESCAATPAPQTYLTGGSTSSGRTFELHLMNPYAGESVVDLVVQSEAGLESNERFDSVVVPPLASTIVDFTELSPGRETLSISIETAKGRVIAVGRQGNEGDSAVWQAVTASQDWFLPVPAGVGQRQLLIGTPSQAEVEYQVDLYGPDGLEEGFESGVLAARSQIAIPLAPIGEEEAALRVIATGPVVATLWLESSSGLASTTGATAPANRWLLPGAGLSGLTAPTVVILNAGLDDSTVRVRPLREDGLVRVIELASDSVVEVIPQTADGYLIESSGPVVALWAAHRGQATVVAIGVPILGG